MATRNQDDIAIIGWDVSPMERHTAKTETQMLLEVVTGAVGDAGITRDEVDFTCAGSCDYVAGQAFSFVQNIDAIGAWPPKRDSHVEMDGAWALYEAWVRLLLGDIDVAVAMGSGRSSTADPALIYPMEMDPFYLAPLGADHVSLAALQARALLDRGLVTERQMADIAVRTRHDALENPYAQMTWRLRRRRPAGRRLRHGPVAPPRPAADHRRSVRHCDRPRRSGAPAQREPDLDHRHRPCVGVALSGHARPLYLARHHGRRPRRPGLTSPRCKWPSCRLPSPTKSRCWSRHWALDPTLRSIRLAGRWPPTRSWRPA